jgi:hypothetical protein
MPFGYWALIAREVCDRGFRCDTVVERGVTCQHLAGLGQLNWLVSSCNAT